MNGIVTNIQRFSIHDGPGIRTTVFLKGCNLRCYWCHNPETLAPKSELQIFLDRCIGCGECFKRCVHGCHILSNGSRQYLRELCVGCGRCAETCYAEALVLVGKTMTVEEVVEEVLRDRPFYETSHGGVTLSGGEPLLQLDFSYAILERSKQEGLHTAIETAASVPWSSIQRVLPVTDLVMMDIKLLDSARHRECTGVGNERILANARRLAEQPQPLIVRTPVIPGVNDSASDIREIAEFVAGFPNLLYYELLPFHPMAKSKYDSLDLDYRAKELKSPSREQMDELTGVACEIGITARHG